MEKTWALGAGRCRLKSRLAHCVLQLLLRAANMSVDEGSTTVLLVLQVCYLIEDTMLSPFYKL